MSLNGATSGYTKLKSADAASNNTVTVPSGTGTMPLMTLATAQATTSGTSIDFTGIPSWVKRVTVMLNQISTSGTSIIQVQVGSGSFATSGYLSSAVGGVTANSISGAVVSSGFAMSGSAQVAANYYQGRLVLTHLGSNIWTANGSLSTTSGTVAAYFVDGTVGALSGTLDRIRITTVNGTDTFDAGSVNILYEG
jgi:hypothetical protein